MAYDPNSPPSSVKFHYGAKFLTASNNDAITSYPAKVGTNTLDGTATYKTGGTNSKPYLQFNGSTDILLSANNTGIASAFTAFLVVQAGVSAGVFFDSAVAGARSGISWKIGTPLDAGLGAFTVPLGVNSIGDGVGTWSGVGSDSIRVIQCEFNTSGVLSVNGVVVATGTLSAEGLTRISFGASAGNFLAHHHYEAIFGVGMSAGEKTDVLAYLFTEYGISFASDYAITGKAAGVSGFAQDFLVSSSPPGTSPISSSSLAITSSATDVPNPATLSGSTTSFRQAAPVTDTISVVTTGGGLDTSAHTFSYLIKTQTKSIRFMGNSLTRGYLSTAIKTTPSFIGTDYPSRFYYLSSTDTAFLYNFGIDSQTTAQMTSDYITNISPGVLTDKAAGRQNIFVLWETGNSMYVASRTAAQATSDMQTAIDTILADDPNAKIWVCNVPDRADGGTLNSTTRAAVNVLLQGLTGIQALIDLSGLAGMVKTNTTYYNVDQTHYNDAGYNYIATTIQAIVEASSGGGSGGGSNRGMSMGLRLGI